MSQSPICFVEDAQRLLGDTPFHCSVDVYIDWPVVKVISSHTPPLNLTEPTATLSEDLLREPFVCKAVKINTRTFRLYLVALNHRRLPHGTSWDWGKNIGLGIRKPPGLPRALPFGA